MSINKHKISETEYFKQCIQDGLKESWQKYLDTIDKEIDFLKEWEKVLRIEIKANNMELTIEKIQEYKKVKEFLDDVCEKYFEATAPDCRYYNDWKFSDNYPNCIIIHYAYYDYRDQYESGDEVIPMDVLIEFSKKLNK